MAALLEQPHRYPPAHSERLPAALADRLGVPPERLSIGAGSVAVVRQIVSAVMREDDDAVMPWPGYDGYPTAVRLARARSVAVPLNEDASIDLDAVRAAIGPRTVLVVLSDPHNPTGTALDVGELAKFLVAVPNRVTVVLDEAYRDFDTREERPDVVALGRLHRNLCVVRTFSKACALAGLRVGYAIADPALAARLRDAALPYAVGAVAEAAALAALEAGQEIASRARAVAAERDWLSTRLRTLGYAVPTSQANFVWLPLGERADEFAASCEQWRVWVKLLHELGVRVTVGDRKASDTLLASAAAFIKVVGPWTPATS